MHIIVAACTTMQLMSCRRFCRCLKHFFLVWTTVDQSRGMLGTFATQWEPYVQMLEEETTLSEILARGVYSAKLKVQLKML